jgi:hypothetical protein
MDEKRRLLDFSLVRFAPGNGVLTPVYRKPFDTLADARAKAYKEKDESGDDSSRHVI